MKKSASTLSVPYPDARALISFIEKSPTAFHAVSEISGILDRSGFERLEESAPATLLPLHKYYITRNGSSLIAFRMPKTRAPFMIAASHSDSPCFKLKEICEMKSGSYLKLNTERYGGMILSSWLDRPLSLAGRVTVRVRKDGQTVLESRNVDFGRDLLIIPNTPPHLNRDINAGFKYNPQVDLLPLAGVGVTEDALKNAIAKAAGAEPDDIVSEDLFVYSRSAGAILGLENEFFASPRIDNLGCAFTTLNGFLTADDPDVTPVFAVFDNEETGSETKQGAASGFLSDTLELIVSNMAFDSDLPLSAKLNSLLSSSLMLSADNAHAKHPNHPEFSDQQNAPVLNGGVVLKYNASQRYTTDAPAAAIFKEICAFADVPVQPYANRSDFPGGSTLGSISNTRVALPSVDIGLGQLAMHSAYETAGCRDVTYLQRACEVFFNTKIRCLSDGSYSLCLPEKS